MISTIRTSKELLCVFVLCVFPFASSAEEIVHIIGDSWGSTESKFAKSLMNELDDYMEYYGVSFNRYVFQYEDGERPYMTISPGGSVVYPKEQTANRRKMLKTLESVLPAIESREVTVHLSTHGGEDGPGRPRGSEFAFGPRHLTAKGLNDLGVRYVKDITWAQGSCYGGCRPGQGDPTYEMLGNGPGLVAIQAAAVSPDVSADCDTLHSARMVLVHYSQYQKRTPDYDGDKAISYKEANKWFRDPQRRSYRLPIPWSHNNRTMILKPHRFVPQLHAFNSERPFIKLAGYVERELEPFRPTPRIYGVEEEIQREKEPAPKPFRPTPRMRF